MQESSEQPTQQSPEQRAKVEQQSRETIEGIAAAKAKRERERGVLRNASDMKEGKNYKKLVIHPGEDGLEVHELHYTHGEDLVVPQGAFIELDKKGEPLDETVRYFLEKESDRVELVDIDSAE